MLFLMYATFMYKITRRQAFRDGPLNILGGGGGGLGKYQKKIRARRKYREKYRAQQTY